MNPKVISGLIFAATTLLVIGIYRLKTLEQQLVDSRMKKITAKDVKRHLNSSEPEQERRVLWRKLLSDAGELFIARRLGRLVDKKLEEADILLSGKEFVVVVIFAAVGSALLIFITTLNLSLTIIMGIVGGIVPFFALSRARVKRLTNFNAQIGDALTIMANSMRSGFSFLQSMEMVSKELPDPIKKEFSRTFREINLGTSTEDALVNMTKRVNSGDLDLVVTAVLVQRQVGGNLAEVLDNIAGTIRERIRIKREIKTLTAQGRISGIIIGLLPVFLCGFMLVAQPNYIMELFTDKIGLLMLLLAVVGELAGMLIIKKIINITF